ncbi:MAG: MFS transporter [Gammaproteobacteria bacterium]
MRPRLLRGPVLAWAFYDWANSAFALTVLAVLYPIFLGEYWAAGAEGADVTFRLAVTSGAASLIVALIAPVLGAISDRGGTRKKFLAGFALLGIVMTGGLYFVAKGAWPVAIGIYLLASVGFYSANTFYDSLIVNVAKPGEFESVSAFGFAAGYLGSALLLTLNTFMVREPEAFGLSGPDVAVRVAFLLVAIWWAVFTIPIMLFVEEDAAKGKAVGGAVREGYRQLVDTFREIRRYRQLFLFLLAFWLYIDGVHTMIQLATNFGQRLGFSSSDLLTALLVTNFVGFPATLFYGWLGEKIGPKRGIYIALAVYIGVSIWAMFLAHVWQFYAMAIMIGTVQGGVQSMSRALYASMVPKDKSAEFFGFYNMLGKFAAVLGPFLVAWASVLSDSPKAVIVALIPLFLAGAFLLSRVDAGAAPDTSPRTP